MIITSAVREQLLSIYSGDSETPWSDQRVKEISDPFVDEDQLESLRFELSLRIRKFALDRCYRSGWQTSVIDTAVDINDLPMLTFFDRLLTEPDHTPVLLRVVFTHAMNLSIPLDSIDGEKLDAYRGITRTMLHDFDTKVQYIGREQGDALINRVLSSSVDARNALTFIAERGHNNPETIIGFLDQYNGAVAPVRVRTDA